MADPFPNDLLEFPDAVTFSEVQQAIYERRAAIPFSSEMSPFNLRIAAGFTLLDYPGGPRRVSAGDTIFGAVAV